MFQLLSMVPQFSATGKTAKNCKKGNFAPTPSTPTPSETIRNSGARNGCANFMGTWDFLILSARKRPMPIEFLILGGGSFFAGGGGDVPISFLWAQGFSGHHTTSGAALAIFHHNFCGGQVVGFEAAEHQENLKKILGP